MLIYEDKTITGLYYEDTPVTQVWYEDSLVWPDTSSMFTVQVDIPSDNYTTPSMVKFTGSNVGVININWGDGSETQTLIGTDSEVGVAHTWATAGIYTININANAAVTNINFNRGDEANLVLHKLVSIKSDTLDNFNYLCQGQWKMQNMDPSFQFEPLEGQWCPAKDFYGTFNDMAMTSIPEGLFYLCGGPEHRLNRLQYTFQRNVSDLVIPDNLFRKMSGNTVEYVMKITWLFDTFANCRTTRLPANLLKGQTDLTLIEGAFKGCRYTYIPKGFLDDCSSLIWANFAFFNSYLGHGFVETEDSDIYPVPVGIFNNTPIGAQSKLNNYVDVSGCFSDCTGLTQDMNTIFNLDAYPNVWSVGHTNKSIISDVYDGLFGCFYSYNDGVGTPISGSAETFIAKFPNLGNVGTNNWCFYNTDNITDSTWLLANQPNWVKPHAS